MNCQGSELKSKKAFITHLSQQARPLHAGRCNLVPSFPSLCLVHPESVSFWNIYYWRQYNGSILWAWGTRIGRFRKLEWQLLNWGNACPDVMRGWKQHISHAFMQGVEVTTIAISFPLFFVFFSWSLIIWKKITIGLIKQMQVLKV